MSRYFDGNDDRVNCGDVSFLDNLANLTVTFWIKFKTLNTNRGIISKWGDFGSGNPATNEQTLLINEDGTNSDEIQFALTDFTSSNQYQIKVTSASNFTTGIWYHVAMTFSAPTTMVVYKDGVSQSLSTTANNNIGGLEPGKNNLEFGNESDENRLAIDGWLAHVHFYNRVLTLNEINQIRYLPSSIRNGILGYWPLWGGSPEADYSGNGNSGTVTGALVSSDNPPINGIFTIPQPEMAGSI